MALGTNVTSVYPEPMLNPNPPPNWTLFQNSLFNLVCGICCAEILKLKHNKNVKTKDFVKNI
jgi:hypothetical protein